MTITPTRRTSDSQRLLRTALTVDAVVTGANALAYLLATGWLGDVLGSGPGPLRGIGAFLLAYAVVIALVARARRIPASGAWFAIVMNVAWTAASVEYAAAGGLTTVGRVWAVLQGLVVLGFALAQLVAFRRGRNSADVEWSGNQVRRG